MKIRLLLVPALLLSSGLAAAPYPGLKSAGIGFMAEHISAQNSDSASPQIGFNGTQGETLLFGGQGTQYQSTQGYCGLALYSAPGQQLFSHFSDQPHQFTLPGSDLYTYMCIKSAGSDGNFLLYALSGGGRAALHPAPGSGAERSDYDEADLKARLKEAMEQAQTGAIPDLPSQE